MWLRLLQGGFVAALVLVLVLLAPSCAGQRPAQVADSGRAVLPVAQLPSEPIVRIRVLRQAGSVSVGGEGAVTFRRNDANPRTTGDLQLRPPIRIHLQDSAWMIAGSAERRAYRWDAESIFVESPTDVVLEGTAFPGSIELRRSGTRIDAINHVGLETYLPGVLARELYSHWQPATFEAQAIAARSYALVMAARSARRAWDMESTVASQAYIGRTQLARALDAVRNTRGTVLVYRDFIVPAYYSSCAGLRGQDAAAIFRNEHDLAPLRGRDHASLGQVSPHVQWGPIVYSRAEFQNRLRAWGRDRQHPVANLGELRAITFEQTNRLNRPTVFRLTDQQGRSVTLEAESLRSAANHQGGAATGSQSSQRIRSSDMQITISDTTVTIQGSGFGHGVGMSQHGAEFLAQRGFNARAILTYFYPQAGLRRLY